MSRLGIDKVAWIGVVCAVWLSVAGTDTPAQTAVAGPPAEVIERHGRVEFSRTNTVWQPVLVTNQLLYVRDRLRTLERSRASLLMAEKDVLRVNELTELQITPPSAGEVRARLDVRQGALYFFHRNGPRELEVQTPTATAGVLGTEFHVQVEADGRTVFSVLDGVVSVSNALGRVIVTNREQAVVAPGQLPVRAPMLEAVNIIQWCLYYPGVVVSRELALPATDRLLLAPVLEAYERGNLKQAMERYPANRIPQSDAEEELYAMLLLSVGKVEESEARLARLAPERPPVRALRWLIAAVKRRPVADASPPVTASELLAFSYYAQATPEELGLGPALEAADSAVKQAPDSGFARARLAELLFSFGRRREAEVELETALQRSPENGQAHALAGFVRAANGRWTAALHSFQNALAVDAALGHAWLGRGLCRIHAGENVGGRQDLEIAAALEPNVSLLRSYLGKAFSQEGEDTQARRELGLAQMLDPNDPTPWLYQALLDRQLNRLNPAVRALEESVALNDNRRLYRSRYLLDQDQAVRGSSLATILQDAGLTEVSLREASRSVNRDYSQDAAHLFLAESYNALRDPKRVSLRYETAWFNERLLANLMAPVDGGNLSQQISQHEYSRFFASRGHSLQSATEYWSSGDWRALATVNGHFDRTAYALDFDYAEASGNAPNAGYQRFEWYSQFKQQITADDAVFLLTKYMDFHGGDVLQYFNPREARRDYEFHEDQEPILLAGYQHIWNPGSQTLFLAGRLDDDFRSKNAGQSGLVIALDSAGTPVFASNERLYDAQYRNLNENYTAEVNQVLENESHLLVAGARVVAGRFSTQNVLTNVDRYQPGLAPIFEVPDGRFHSTDILRLSGYAYYTWKAGSRLLLTAGLSYDYLEYPENFLNVPVSTRQTSAEQWSPKLGLTWTASDSLQFRAAWTRALGGVTFDESIRLEPTQLAGFIQSYRTIISETEAGSVSAPQLETLGAGVDWTPYRGAYAGVQFERLQEDVNRKVGVYNLQQPPNSAPRAFPSQTPENLDYLEHRVGAHFNQLLGDVWAARVAYQFTRSDLERRLTAIDPMLYSRAALDQQADLHQTWLQLLFHHPGGLFSRAEAVWTGQDYRDSEHTRTSENLWQFNLYFGYRLKHNRGDVLLGLLNLTDQDYRLQPLSPYLDLPRERMLYARARFRF